MVDIKDNYSYIFACLTDQTAMSSEPMKMGQAKLLNRRKLGLVLTIKTMNNRIGSRIYQLIFRLIDDQLTSQ